MQSISKLTINLLKSYLGKDCEKYDNVDLKMLKSFTDFHGISPIICVALEKEKSIEKSALKPFTDDKMQAVIRYAKQEYLRGEITKALNKSQIPHLILKGSKIAEFYPEPWQRVGCDIDILINKKDVKTAKEVFSDELKLHFSGVSGHDVSFISENGVEVELHYESVEDNIKSADLWLDATKQNEYLYTLSAEMNFVYALAHTANHFSGAGCGIRSVLDFYFLDKNSNCNKEKLNLLLQKYGLLSFYNGFKQLSGVWFNNAETTPFTAKMQDYILQSGCYGTMANYYTYKARGDKSIFSFCKNRLKNLSSGYRASNTPLAVIPFYLLVRACASLFRKGGYVNYKIRNGKAEIEDYTKNKTELVQKLGLSKK